MKPTSFTALTVSNIDNGTTTHSLPIHFTGNAAHTRTVRAIGGGVVDLYGSGATRTTRTPAQRTVRYLAVFSTAVLLNTHINVLLVDDIGKRGTLLYAGEDGSSYSQLAALRDVQVRRLTDRDDEGKAEIILMLDELTLVAEVV